MRHMAFTLLIPALAVAGAGCATKGYVREVVGQSEAKSEAKIGEEGKRVDEQGRRIEEQTKRVGTQGKQLEDMGGRFTKLETSVDEFGNIARSAGAKADEAAARAGEVAGRVSRLEANRYRRKLVETIQVHFGVDRWELTDAAQTALAELIKELVENPELTVDLEGYSDSQGSAAHNLQLSERRVESVRRFLVARGVELPRINWIGMGEVSDKGAKADRAKNRRVTVRLLLPADDVGVAPSGPKARSGEKSARQADAASAVEAPSARPPDPGGEAGAPKDSE